LYSVPAERPIIESSAYTYSRDIKSAGVIAVCVGCAARLRGSVAGAGGVAICAAAVVVRKSPSVTKRATACMDSLQ
jgi:hypothetical protein